MSADRFEKQLTALKEKKTRIRDFLEDGTYTREEGKERLAEIENQIAATKISLSEARIEQFDIEATVTYANHFISDLARQWFDLAPQVRPRFQRLVFPEGIPFSRNTGCGTNKNVKLGLIYEINRRSNGDLQKVVRPVGFEPTTLRLRGECSTN